MRQRETLFFIENLFHSRRLVELLAEQRGLFTWHTGGLNFCVHSVDGEIGDIHTMINRDRDRTGASLTNGR
jgi:hypothetical protein